jgi:hypothetical protein
VGGADLLGLLQLEGHRVDGDDVRAPAMRAPWMAPEPTPPQPTTTTVSPGLTLARSTAEPKPVEMPQLMSAAAFMLDQGSMRTSEFSWQTISSAKVPSWAIRFRFSPARW